MVEELGRALPAVEVGLQREKPALKIGTKGFIHLSGGPTMSFPSPDKADLLASRPDAFTSDEHHDCTPWLMVELAKISKAELREILRGAWRIRASSSIRREHPEV